MPFRVYFPSEKDEAPRQKRMRQQILKKDLDVKLWAEGPLAHLQHLHTSPRNRNRVHGTILRFASVPLRKIGTRFLGPDSVFYLLDLDLAVEI